MAFPAIVQAAANEFVFLTDERGLADNWGRDVGRWA